MSTIVYVARGNIISFGYQLQTWYYEAMYNWSFEWDIIKARVEYVFASVRYARTCAWIGFRESVASGLRKLADIIE